MKSVNLDLVVIFAIEVFNSIQNIVNYPTAWSVIEEDARHCLVNRFPYGFVYYLACRCDSVILYKTQNYS